jgi:hypothetical protein
VATGAREVTDQDFFDLMMCVDSDWSNEHPIWPSTAKNLGDLEILDLKGYREFADLSLDEMPLYINSDLWWQYTVAKWRLEHAK